MSRYTVTAIDPRYSIELGWDAPMTTFFAQVLDSTIDIDEEEVDPIVLWVGDSDMAIPTIDQLQAAIASYAILSPEVIEQLQADYDRTWTPSPLQQLNRRFIGNFQEGL